MKQQSKVKLNYKLLIDAEDRLPKYKKPLNNPKNIDSTLNDVYLEILHDKKLNELLDKYNLELNIRLIDHVVFNIWHFIRYCMESHIRIIPLYKIGKIMIKIGKIDAIRDITNLTRKYESGEIDHNTYVQRRIEGAKRARAKLKNKKIKL